MDKKTLIERFRNKASSRKKMLFALYSNLISSFENLEIIAAEINSDLEVENLITRADIKYCRYQFVQKTRKRSLKEALILKEKPMKNSKEMQWTNPDTIEKLILKSKFET